MSEKSDQMNEGQPRHPLDRERTLEPEGTEAPPLWLWIVIFSVAFFGAYYMGAYVGDFSADPHYMYRDRVASVADEAEVVAVDGGQIYTQRCQTCHQADGEGVAGVFPPLNQATQWLTGPEGRPIRILLHGLGGELNVRGETYNGQMPAFGQLDDEEIAAVLTHVRQSWDNDASEITADQVAAVRDAEAGRTDPWRADELLTDEGSSVPGSASGSDDEPVADE
ncbi:MAG: c-type cytochrome [Bacteroidetes bacterium]|jgi:mono/diheme cytochrome c family protein|nr:c-type cytochrome [Bacteroidota bacterium]